MSTRSLIARLQPDGKNYDVRYCHSDGYEDGVGLTLRQHYTNPQKVEQLFALGDLSVLGEELGEKHDFDWRMSVEIKDWDADSRNNWTRAYHRDRGESLELATCFKANLRETAHNYNAEFVYVWKPEYLDWVGYSVGQKKLSRVTIPEPQPQESHEETNA